MILVSLVLVSYHLLPVVAAVWLWRANYPSRTEWALKNAFVWAGSLFLYLAGWWALVGYPLRYACIICPAVATILSWQKAQRLPVSSSGGWKQWCSLGFLGACVCGAAVLIIAAWRGRQPDRPGFDLLFPLHHGTYYIGQGGSSRVVNAHRAVSVQQYALDITKLNRLGRSATGLLPSDLSKYAIFGDSVVSPCDGEVVDAADGLADLIPPSTDRKNTKGNYVVLRCRSLNVDVLLAHLQNGSVQSRIGETVGRGQEIGRVGNSGNTSQPHLHLQANSNGQAVPMTFSGRFLVRNDLVRGERR